jgi:hypothetical protein
LGVSVSVHVDSATAIAPGLFTVCGKPCPVLRLEGALGNVALHADRPGLIRLQNAINSLLADLDAAQAQESAA